MRCTYVHVSARRLIYNSTVVNIATLLCRVATLSSGVNIREYGSSLYNNSNYYGPFFPINF